MTWLRRGTLQTAGIRAFPQASSVRAHQHVFQERQGPVLQPGETRTLIAEACFMLSKKRVTCRPI